MQGNNEVYDLTKENYLDATMGDGRYHVYGKDKIPRDFAICPACDNPIQIVGLYKQLKNTDRPYGKHYNRDTNIAKHNETAYRYCPYASNHYNINKDARKEELTIFEKDIYNTLRENADLAFYILKQDTGISFSKRAMREILKYYKWKDAHLYYWSTMYNIPWMLLYFANSIKCFGLRVKKNSELYEKLSQLKDVKLVEINSNYVIVKNKDGGYLNLSFATTIHRRKVVDDELVEYVVIKFFKESEDKFRLFDTLFSIKMPINESRFLNLIHSEKAQKYRDPEIVAMAKEIFPELI